MLRRKIDQNFQQKTTKKIICKDDLKHRRNKYFHVITIVADNNAFITSQTHRVSDNKQS